MMTVRKPQKDPKTPPEGTKSAARRARKTPTVPPEHLESVPRPLSLQASEHLIPKAASAGAAKRKQLSKISLYTSLAE